MGSGGGMRGRKRQRRKTQREATCHKPNQLKRWPQKSYHQHTISKSSSHSQYTFRKSLLNWTQKLQQFTLRYFAKLKKSKHKKSTHQETLSLPRVCLQHPLAVECSVGPEGCRNGVANNRHTHDSRCYHSL